MRTHKTFAPFVTRPSPHIQPPARQRQSSTSARASSGDQPSLPTTEEARSLLGVSATAPFDEVLAARDRLIKRLQVEGKHDEVRQASKPSSRALCNFGACKLILFLYQISAAYLCRQRRHMTNYSCRACSPGLAARCLCQTRSDSPMSPLGGGRCRCSCTQLHASFPY